jgi:hypothetical protein
MTRSPGPLARWRHRAISVGLLATIAWFYIWTVSQALPLPFGTKAGMYPLLTDGFLAGQLSLPLTPHPDLLATKDPYSDHANRPPFLHDASFYKGKYYAYFGVTPVVLLFLPFRVLGMGNLPESLAVAIFVFGGVLFSLLMLSHIRRTHFPTVPKVSYETYLMLAFGGAIPFFLRRPAVYEVAIACGVFCLAAAIYFLVSIESAGKVSLWRAGLASLFLGLAVGARPHLLLASSLLGLVAWRLWSREKQWPALAVMGALFAPIALVGFALGLYNYARFDSWTEFGRWYQLGGENVRELKFSVLRIPLFSYLYLWHAGHVNLSFPYTHVMSLTVPVGGGVTVEPVAGVFYTTPILYVLAFLPVLRSAASNVASQHRTVAGSAHAWAWTLVVLALAQVVFLGTFPGATMRYIVDFSPLLMAAAGIVMMGIATRLATSRWWVLAKIAMVLLVGVTVFLNVGLGVTGYYDNLRGANPKAFASLKSGSDRVVDALVPWVFTKDLQLVSIDSPGGVEQRVGVPSFWVGDIDAEFEVFAKRDGYMVFRTDPDIPPERKLVNVRLTIRSAGGYVESHTVGNDEATFVIPVRRGHNQIFFRIVYDTSPPLGRRRIMRLDGKEWMLSSRR